MLNQRKKKAGVMMAYTIRDKECWIVGLKLSNCVQVSVRGCIIVGILLALLSYNRSIFMNWGVHVNLKWREVVGSKETVTPAPNQTRLHRITRACIESLFFWKIIRSMIFWVWKPDMFTQNSCQKSGQQASPKNCHSRHALECTTWAWAGTACQPATCRAGCLRWFIRLQTMSA